MTGVPSRAEFEHLLSQTLVPDNAIIKQAEDALKVVVKDPHSVEALLSQCIASANPGVRQVAAVQLRKSVQRHWPVLDAAARSTIKGLLLERIRDESVNLVRKNVASVASMVAKKALPAEGWPELLQFLVQCTQSENADHREVGLMVFERLADIAGEHFKPWLSDLQQIFSTALVDPEMRVRVAGLRAACHLVQWISDDKEILKFREIIPAMAACVGQCVDAGDEDNACEAFTVFFELISNPVPILTPHIPELVKFALQAAANEDLQIRTRECAVELVTSVAESKPKAFRQPGMVQAVVGVLFGMASEPEDEDGADERERMAQSTTSSIAMSALDVIACQLPSRLVYQPVMQTASAFSHDANPWRRRSALQAVGIVAEGCGDHVREGLGELVAFVAQGAQDPESRVRDAACFTIREFSVHLQPDINEHHGVLLPAIFACLDASAGGRVQEMAGMALEAFCENLEEHILPYLAPLMEKLVELLMGGKREVQVTVTSAIASVAAAVITAAQESGGSVQVDVFHQYIAAIMPCFAQIFSATTEDMMVLRGHAMECAGVFIQCFEKQQGAAMAVELMAPAFAGLDLGSSEVREFSFGFFANAAEVLEKDFAPFLEPLMQQLFKSCSSDDVIWDDGDGGEDSDGEVDLFNGEDDDSDEDVGLIPGKGFSVRTACLDEKASACQCIGQIANAVGAEVFAPYLELALTTLTELGEYFHEDVRAAVRAGLWPLVRITKELHPSPGGEGADLHPNVKQVLQSVWEGHIEALQMEAEKIVVARTCFSISMMADWGGRAVLQPEAELLPPLCGALCDLLNKKSPCQGPDSEDEDNDEDEDHDHDEALIDTVTECATSIAKCFGPEFGPYLPDFIKALTAYALPYRPALDRSMGIGALAEFMQHAGAATQSPEVLPLLQPLAAALCACLDDAAHEPVRRNAAYCAGVLCLHAGAYADAFLPTVLGKLGPLLQRDGAVADATVDNAAGAVARIVTRLGPAAVAGTAELQQLVPALLNAVPIKEDYAENVMVATALVELASNEATAGLVTPHSVQMAMAMAGAVAAGRINPGEAEGSDPPREGALPPELHDGCVAILRPLLEQGPCAQAVQAAMVLLVPEAQASLQIALAGVARTERVAALGGK